MKNNIYKALIDCGYEFNLDMAIMLFEKTQYKLNNDDPQSQNLQNAIDNKSNNANNNSLNNNKINDKIDNKSNNLKNSSNNSILNTKSFGNNTSSTNLKIRSLNVLYLAPYEIKKIEFIEEKNYIIHTYKLSLCGINGPLPNSITEWIIHRSYNCDFAIQEFLNIFTTRLIGKSYQISKKLHQNLQDVHPNQSIIGKIVNSFNDNILSNTYSFWNVTKSTKGLEAMLANFFNFNVEIKEYHPSITRNNNLQCQLTSNNKNMYQKKLNKLGISVLGNKVYEKDSSILINIYNEYSDVKLLLDGRLDQMLNYILKKYCGNFLSYKIRAHVKNMPNATLGSVKLAINSKLKKSNLSDFGKTTKLYKCEKTNLYDIENQNSYSNYTCVNINL